MSVFSWLSEKYKKIDQATQPIQNRVVSQIKQTAPTYSNFQRQVAQPVQRNIIQPARQSINLAERQYPQLKTVNKISNTINPTTLGPRIVRGMIRGSASNTVSLINRNNFTPTTKSEKFFLGNDVIKPAEKSYFAEKTGIPALGVLAVGAGTVMDVTGAGGVGKKLAKEATEQGVRRILGKEAANYGDDVIKMIAKTKDTKIIDNLLSKKSSQVATDILSSAKFSLKDRTPKPGGVERAISEIKAGISKPVRVRTLEDGSIAIEDGAHRVEAYKQLGIKNVPIEDVTSHYIQPKPGEVVSNGVSTTSKIDKQLQKGLPQELTNTKIATSANLSELEKLTQQKNQALISNKGQVTSKTVDQVLQNNSSFNASLPQKEQIVKDTNSILKGGQVKERGFVTTVKESSKTPQAVKDLVNGNYVVKNDAQRIADARNLIKSDPMTAEKLALNPRNDNDITIGNQLIDSHLAAGNFNKVTQLTDAMAQSGTELGRAVHAFADYDKTTPAGAIKFAQQTINKFNKENPSNKLALNDESVKKLMDMAHKIQQLPQGRERNIVSQELMKEVNNLIPSTFGDKAVTVWKAGLLTSLRTTERNLLGNAVHGVAEIIKDPVAVLNDVLLKSKTGKRTISLTTKGMIGGVKKGLVAGKDIMTRGYDPERTIEKFDVHHITWEKTPVQQGLKKYTDFVFNWMGAQDKPFYHSAFARSLYDQAGAVAINAGKRGDNAFVKSLVDSPTEDMLKNATTDATKAVFQDKNALSNMINGLKQKAGGARWATDIVAPFTGVPSSIAGQIVAYSPIGLAKGVIKDIGILSGKYPELQRQAGQEIGRGVIGTGVMGIGALLAAKGLITGQPKDANEAKQWELEGKQANSVLIGGKWRALGSIGPEALVLLAGSKLQASDDKMAAAGNIGKDFLSQTFLQGVQAPLNAITDPARYAGTYLSGQIASGIPNMVKDVAKAFDPTQRETYVPKNIPESIKNSLKSGIPLLRNSLLPKRNALGNPLPNETTGYKAFVDLFNSKTPVSNPVVNELSRLFTADESATPSKLTPSQTINGKKINLQPKNLDLLESYTGQEVQKYWGQVMNDPNYQVLSDADKSTKLGNFLTDVRTVGKVQVAYNSGLITQDEVKTAYDKMTAKQKEYFDTGNLNISLVKAPAKTATKKLTTRKTTKKSSSAKKAKKIKLTAPKLTSLTVKTPSAKKPTIKLTTMARASGGQVGRGPRALKVKKMF